MESSNTERVSFTAENIDTYLKEIAKEYRKANGKRRCTEIILVGGSSAVLNYGFREMTYDVYVFMYGSLAMEEVLQEFANMSADELLAYFGKDGSDDDSLSDDDFQGYGRR
ncbi:MAG: hypothetical protein LUE12_03260 [Ruminococcus sp.]|nr:hypothetical protein [Ruminococcus sp.]